MDNHSHSKIIVDKDQQENIEDFIEDGPNPADFDVFLPLVCKKYCVDADIIVTRCFQVKYVSAAINKKHGQKRKMSAKRPSVVISEDLTSHEENNGSEIDENIPNVGNKIVKIETVYDSNKNLVQVKFLKNKEIPRKVMQVLALTIPYQQHLTSITINSGLEMYSLYELSKCLPDSQITELCLDGTFLNKANFYILLTNSKLKHLSLARCSLNDSDVKMIAEQLKEPCPAATVLSALNLSTNRITDVGAKYIAEVLRTNRQLCYLNLAGNTITDEGGVSILNTLQKFPLQPQELSESGARLVANLKKRNDLINTFISELQTPTSTKSSKKKLTKGAKLESQSMNQPFELTADAKTMQRAEVFADSQLELSNEPFINNIETHDGVVHCFGNNTLCCLNLAYNNLTYVSVRKLVEVLKVQQSLDRTPRGLIKVVIEGNLMPEDCEEFDEIDYLLHSGLKLFLRKKSYFAAKKKSVSPKSSAG